MKRIILAFVFALVLNFGVYAESDTEINDRLIAIQKQVCSNISDSSLKKTCLKLSKTFLPNTNKSWKVERVVDGDTIVIVQNKETIKVRLMGVDTPETKSVKKGIQCFGPEAYEFSKQKLEGKSVSITFDSISGSKDIYNRYLAYVYLSGESKSFNQQLIENGYAREYSMDQPYQYRTEFQAIAKKAENNKLGLWGECIQ